MGKKRECLIIDINEAGGISVEVNQEIAKEYKLQSADDDKGASSERISSAERSFERSKTQERQKEYSPYSKPYYGN